MSIINTTIGVESIEIPTNSDLNDYIYEGRYYIGVDGTTIINNPNNNNGFALIVIYNATYGNHGVTQFFIPHNEYKVYMRFYTYYPARWSDWKVVAQPIE